MRSQILRFDALPESFAAPQGTAVSEGHTFLERLGFRWRECAHLQDALAAVLGVADDASDLIAIGAQTTDEYDPHPDYRRLRHFYVHPDHRLLGFGQALAAALIQDALSLVPVLHLRATYPASIAFWDAMGFAGVEGRSDRTHRITR